MKRMALCLAEGSLTADKWRLDTAITTLLLTCDDLAVKRRCLDGVAQGKYRIDAKLVLSLYAACDKVLKVELACSPVVSRMPPREFKQVFNKTYRRADLGNAQRHDLAWNLDSFLYLNPRQIPEFEPVILGLLRSSRRNFRYRGLNMAGRLNRLEDRDLAIMKKSLRSKVRGIRINALVGFSYMAERFKEVDRRLQSFLTSSELRGLASQLGRFDPEKYVRRNARYLLGLLRGLPRSPDPGSRKRA